MGAGGLLLFFVPGMHLSRGGLAWLLGAHWSAFSPRQYYLALVALLLSGICAFCWLLLLARWACCLLVHVRYRRVSLGALLVLLATVIMATGWVGLAVCAVATGIGLIPVLWGSRRVNLMGLLLLPIGLSSVGLADNVARMMGLF
jgi:putative membrane protein